MSTDTRNNTTTLAIFMAILFVIAWLIVKAAKR